MGRRFFLGRLRVFKSCWIFCDTPPFPPAGVSRTVSGPPPAPPFTVRREPCWAGLGRGRVVFGAVGGGVRVDCVYMCVCVCVYVCVCACTCIYTCTCACVHVCVNTVHMYMYIYIRTCTCTWMVATAVNTAIIMGLITEHWS